MDQYNYNPQYPDLNNINNTGYINNQGLYNQAPNYPQQQQQLDTNIYNPQLQYGNQNFYPQLQPNTGYLPPPVATNGDMVVVYREGQLVNHNGSNKYIRITEIELILKNNFGCYICWLWFNVIMTFIAIIDSITGWSNAITLCNQGFEDFYNVNCSVFNAVLIFDLISNILTEIAYTLGIYAIQYKDLTKNKIFIVLLIIILFMRLFLSILFYSEYSSYFSAYMSYLPFSSVLGVIISIIVIIVANQVNNLLKERAVLLQDHKY